MQAHRPGFEIRRIYRLRLALAAPRSTAIGVPLGVLGVVAAAAVLAVLPGAALGRRLRARAAAGIVAPAAVARSCFRHGFLVNEVLSRCSLGISRVVI